MMSSYYYPTKEADMASVADPLCLERGSVLPTSPRYQTIAIYRKLGSLGQDDEI